MKRAGSSDVARLYTPGINTTRGDSGLCGYLKWRSYFVVALDCRVFFFLYFTKGWDVLAFDFKGVRGIGFFIRRVYDVCALR